MCFFCKDHFSKFFRLISKKVPLLPIVLLSIRSFCRKIVPTKVGQGENNGLLKPVLFGSVVTSGH